MVAAAIREASLGRAEKGDIELLRHFRLVDSDGQLTDWGATFESAWWVYGNKSEAEVVFKAGLLLQPATTALMQVLNGRGSVPVAGAAHYLARHELADSENEREVRRFLQMLNDLGIVAYSKQKQTVRLVEPIPDDGGEVQPAIRVIEPDRPYSNVQNLREVLRGCREFIWWTEPHFVPKLLEPLAYEADGDRIGEIRLLTGAPGKEQASLLKRGKEDFKRFSAQMDPLGITAAWRVYASRPPHHDRYLVEKTKTWNLPPINTLLRGDYSEIIETRNRPPFEQWWAAAADLIG